WVLVYHGAEADQAIGASASLTAADAPFLAFRALRSPGRIIRVHPLACALMDVDFDGDVVQVFLPLTAQAQQEAGDRLSIAATIARHPQLLKRIAPSQIPVWGLASLSLTPEGRQELAALAGAEIETPSGFVTKTSIAQAIQRVFERDGFAAAAA